MALPRMKTEMHGDKSRWMRRQVAKDASARLRRMEDRAVSVADLDMCPDMCTCHVRGDE